MYDMRNALLVFALQEESANLFSEYQTLYTGVGKINATYALMNRLAQIRPPVVINLGTAGSSTYSAGSVIHSTKFMQRDMDVSPLGFSLYKTPFSDDPVILEYGLNISYLPSGICGSGDNFVTTHTNQYYDMVDMEAYALAKVCKSQDIPFVCIKYISDGANETASFDWNAALLEAAKKLKETIVAYESYLKAKIK